MKTASGPTSARLAALWWDRLPDWVGQRWPPAGAVLADGDYLTRWPPVAALTGPVLGALGVAVALIVRWSPDSFGARQAPGLYSQYLWFVLVAVAAGMLGRQLGAWVCAGYTVLDVVTHLVDPKLGLTRLYADMLLLLPCLLLGLRVRQLAKLVAGLVPAAHRRLLDARMLNTACAFFVTLLWANAFPILVRPTYVWISTSLRIPTGVIRPVQTHVLLIALVAGAAMALRLTYEPAALRPRARSAAPASPMWLTKALPPGSWQSAAVQAAVTTLLLAGMMLTWTDALAFAAFMTLFYGARSGLVPWLRLPDPLTARITGVPPVTRLLAALGGAAVLSWLLLALLWNHLTTFRPLLVVTAVFLLIFQLLSSMSSRKERGAQPV